MKDAPIIEVNDLWKRYGLPPFLPWKKRTVQDHEWALRDISFEVPRGGSLGILGKNGAGKSTLLKVLAGVTPPDKGQVSIRGKVFPMIELMAGMSMELSGLENIHILGTIMGLSPDEIRRITPLVEDFSELGEWIRKPLWQYSSGMLGRIAFGIAVNIRSDILLVDEVLSTGDIMFQKKCQVKVQKMLAGGTTLIFVSHSPYQVEKLCERGLLLESGQNVCQGSSTQVMQEYLQRTVSTAHNKAYASLSDADLRPGTGDVRVTAIELLDAKGDAVDQITTGDAVTIRICYHAQEDVYPLNISMTLYESLGAQIAVFAPARGENEWLTIKKGEGTIECHIPCFMVMGKGLYFNVKISTTYLLDGVENALLFDAIPAPAVAQRTASRGAVFFENNWSIN